MEKWLKSLSLFEFQDQFPDDESCMKSLASLKWKDDYNFPELHRTIMLFKEWLRGPTIEYLLTAYIDEYTTASTDVK